MSSEAIWVSASAGTGKTTLLTARVLTLLLRGTPPEQILCITYTKAAAAEMQARLSKRLRAWAVMEEEKLIDELSALTDHFPTPSDITYARGLFEKLLTSIQGVRIQTLHSFCQSLLAAFPLEAGIEVGARLLDEAEAASLRVQAQAALLNSQADDVAEAVREAVGVLAYYRGESSIHEVLEGLTSKRTRVGAWIEAHGGVQAAFDSLAPALGVSKDSTRESIIHAMLHDPAMQREELQRAQLLFAQSKPDKYPKQSVHMRDFLRGEYSEEYLSFFLTKEDAEPRKTGLGTKEMEKSLPGIQLLLKREAERLQTFADQLRAVEILDATRALLLVHLAVEQGFAERKAMQGMLDYEDLLTHSVALLEGQATQWVRYRLDARLRHMLLDEAQDTSPLQWRIVQALAQDFFHADDDADHSLFVVGDIKQSIYSFQGAEPDYFHTMRKHFSAYADLKQQHLEKSYRSSAPVLQLVDAVFTHTAAAQGVVEGRLHHAVARADAGGHVECWPLMAASKKEVNEDGETEDETAVSAMANHVASVIAEWLSQGRMLANKGRPIAAGDIMILLRNRKPLGNALMVALKDKGVPVQGADRLRLNDHIAVEDLIALGAWLLLPEDDYTLASLLKSPLFGMDEEALFALAHPRTSSLWEALQQSTFAPPLRGGGCREAIPGGEHATRVIPPRSLTLAAPPQGGGKVSDVLQHWRDLATSCSPYVLYHHLLEREGMRMRFAERLGSSVHEVLDEFLNLVYAYEQQHPMSLQLLVQWLQQQSTDIKRDVEQGQDAVRILTTHGAKGLQAPIVILPEANQPLRLRQQIFWSGEDAFDAPFWCFNSKQDSQKTRLWRENAKQKQREEYHRLLYVALTRAEDELYVGGWENRHPNKDSWYALVKQAMAGFPDAHTSEDGSVSISKTPEKPPAPKLQLSPSYAPVPEGWDKPLSVTQATAPHPSPLPRGEAKSNAIDYGIALHALLQHCSSEAQATAWIARQKLPSVQASAMLAEWRALLNNPELAWIFAPDTFAEAPLIGKVNETRVQGRVDRLVVTPEKITVVDFKTHRTPPVELPEEIRQQMTLYCALLQQIYPQHAIEAAVLWTVNGRISYLF